MQQYFKKLRPRLERGAHTQKIMTSSAKITNILASNKHFIGCFAHDNLPDLKSPCSVIINTDNKSNPGDHWTALILDRNNQCLYFDSFGAPVLSTHILLKLFPKHEEIVFCSKQVQAIKSTKCAYFVMSFVDRVINEKTYADFISLFSDNLTLNDTICTEIVKTIL